ncbi:permease prefix domain 1-containing protein [Microbacterium sp. ZW T5_56]|uniref:permease prefix domain 1-containing protein n=1 Tax=Microbacterium sp. ZW T5_56 TaxID=3378081 RepID=UPI003851AD52
MTATLTERYIDATVRSLRPQLQDDVREELATSIADAVEARVEQGEPAEDAERAVLNGLGDPGVLAAGYADRPLFLIGPRYFMTWWRLLKLLLWIVPLSVMAAVALGLAISNAPSGQIIGSAVGVGISVIVHLCFWVTLVFFVLERVGTDPVPTWTVDQLPEPRENSASLSTLVGSLVFLGASIAAVLWDRFRGFVFVDGDIIPVLHPGLWPVWMLIFLVIVLAEGGVALAVFRQRRWTAVTASVNTLLAVVFATVTVWLLSTGQLINPELLATIAQHGGEDFHYADLQSADEGGIFRILAVLLGAGIIAACAWDAVDGWRQTRRSAAGRVTG